MRVTHGVLAVAAVAVVAAASTAALQPAARTAALRTAALRSPGQPSVRSPGQPSVRSSGQPSGQPPAAKSNTRSGIVPAIASAPILDPGSPSPASVTDCLSSAKVRCYSPAQLQAAYDLAPLYKKGIDGKGQTIAIIESFGSPTIRHDLAVFDQEWNLPDPTLNVLEAGNIPSFSAKNPEMVSWAQETTLDVEYAHALAPRATIDLVETPVAETEGVQGFPQIIAAEQALIDRYRPDVISQSFGATEDTLPGFATRDYGALAPLRTAFTDAQAHDVTVLAASGDNGATAPGPDGVTLYKHQAVSWPASDPVVTAVGGTDLTLDQSGTRVAPDTVWNDSFGASGGGRSVIFGRPLFQDGVAGATGSHRGVPDIAMSASVNGAVWTYGSYLDPKAGWQLFGGTSESAPLFAGIVALADQLAGHPLGDINPALYTLGAEHDPARTGIVPVTAGDNTYSGVKGFAASEGYNLAAGWGTIDAAVFVPALARFVPQRTILLSMMRHP